MHVALTEWTMQSACSLTFFFFFCSIFCWVFFPTQLHFEPRCELPRMEHRHSHSKTIVLRRQFDNLRVFAVCMHGGLFIDDDLGAPTTLRLYIATA